MRKTDWMRRTWVKALAFLLALALIPVMAVNIAALLCGFVDDWWAEKPTDMYRTEIVTEEIRQNAYRVMAWYEGQGNDIWSMSFLTDPETTNFRFSVYDRSGSSLADTISRDGIPIDLDYPVNLDGNLRIRCGIAKELKAQDDIYWAVRAAERLSAVFRTAVPVLIAAAALFLLLVVFLACVAGRRPGREEAVAGWQEKIPLDLYLAAAGLAFTGAVFLVADAQQMDLMRGLPLYLLLFLGVGLGVAALLLGLWMTFCTRVKLGGWWRNTVIYQVFRFLWKGLRWCWSGILRVIQSIPLFWRTALFAGVFCVLVFGLAMSQVYEGVFLALAAFFVIACAAAVQLRTLQAGGRALAAGDLDSKVDTKRLFWDFRNHGENLNDISRGMQTAVERQLRSERLKTELITNVSHDIKTPLTSIISYVDLLLRDPQGEHAPEYLEVLDRQSRRLKKLTEDLVEVSKASTGNVAVNASRCSIRELLTQALGEYSERLEKAGLESVLTVPDRLPDAWADGTLIWRVLDNLFSNACKYALPGTRFYIDAKEEGPLIRVSFKNISRQQLNVTAEELMERFVRGDASRSGEGSGLGLNIARSLMELQGGSLSLTVDGDLFRADITLPSMD